MFCWNCGSNIVEKSEFCDSCGAPLNQTFTPQQPSNQQLINLQLTDVPVSNSNQQEPYIEQPNLEQQQNYDQPQPTYNQQQRYFHQPNDQYSMNWYKFLIYFSLFAGAVLNIIYAISTITGTIYQTYNSSAEYIYSVYPGLQILDTIYSILLLGLAVLGIITRQKLAHYKALGITLLISFYISNILIALIYVIVSSNIIGTFAASDSFKINFLSGIVLIIANLIYFNRRKALFH